MPDGRAILGGAQDPLSVWGRDEQSRGFGQSGVLPLYPLRLQQFLIPVSFQAASHQAIVWIDCHVATTSQICFILPSFQSQVPLPIDLLGTGLQLIERGERNSQLSRLDRFYETDRNCLVNTIA